jgi:hypothetical protein
VEKPSAPNEASKAAFEQLQRQCGEKDVANKAMALDLKTLTTSVQELKAGVQSILELLDNNNNNNNPLAANPPAAARAQQEGPEEEGA